MHSRHPISYEVSSAIYRIDDHGEEPVRHRASLDQRQHGFRLCGSQDIPNAPSRTNGTQVIVGRSTYLPVYLKGALSRSAELNVLRKDRLAEAVCSQL